MGHGPDAASGEQSGGQKRARDRHAGAHLATTPQRPGHQQGPTAQEEPRQGRWQRLEAQRLHHRGPDQHGATTPEAFGLLEHLPGRHLGQGGGRPAEIDPHRRIRGGVAPPPRRPGARDGSRGNRPGCRHPGPAWDGLDQPPLAPAGGRVIGGTEAAWASEYQVEHHLPGAALQHRRSQFGLELPGPGPGTHPPPQGRSAPLLRAAPPG